MTINNNSKEQEKAPGVALPAKVKKATRLQRMLEDDDKRRARILESLKKNRGLKMA